MALTKSRWIKTRWGGTVGAILTVAVGWILFLSVLGKPFVNNSYDLPFRYRNIAAPEEVVIIYMDDISHQEMGQDPSRPWSRQLHARLIDYLTEQGAKAIVFDVVFSSPASNFISDEAIAETWDRELTKAMKRSGRVVVAAEYGRTEMEGAVAWRVMPIYPRIAESVAGVGHSYTIQSADYTIRLFPEAVDYGGTPFPPLCVAVAELLGVKDTGAGRERYLNYFGPPLTLRSENYYTVAKGDAAPGMFANKIVFIGARQSTGMIGEGKDEFRSPWPRHEDKTAVGGEHIGVFAPGTEVQATAFANLLHRNWMVKIPDKVQLAMFLVMGILLGFGLAIFRPVWTVVIAHLLVALIGGVAMVLHWQGGIWFAWLIMPIQVSVAGGWAVIFNAIRLHFEKMLAEAEARTEKAEKEQERIEKERAQEQQKRLEADKLRLEAEQKLLEQERKVLRDTLSKHLSPGRTEQLLKNPDLLKPVTTRQVISIMFSDIEAYSKLSEMLSLEELAVQLNSYYELTLSCVHETDGTVVKLIGDAIFAIWNAPFPLDDHARRACLSAFLLRSRLQEYDAHRAGPPLKTRVGLHVGEASVGNIGSSARFDYTAVGDSVNIASRLEGMNKMVGTGVLATAAIHQVVGDAMVWRPVGLFRFKGVNAFQHVFEVVAPGDRADESRIWRESFAEGWELFSQRQWDAAEKEFKHTLDLKPDDGPSLYYLARLPEFRASELPPDWHGQIILHEK